MASKRSVASDRASAPPDGVEPAKDYRPRRGRPSSQDVALMHGAILSAAKDQFLEKGFDGASMEAIATAARVSKPTLYAKYPNKGELLRALILNRIEEWSKEAHRQDWRVKGGVRERLAFHARMIVRWRVRPDVMAFHWILQSVVGSANEAATLIDEFGKERMMTTLVEQIRLGAETDGITVRDPRGVAFALMTMIAGWFWLKEPLGKVSQKEALRFARQAVDMLVDGRAGW